MISPLPFMAGLQSNSRRMGEHGHRVLAAGLVLCGLLLCLASCAPQHQVVIRVDGEEKTVNSTGRTVGDVLAEQDIELGQLDRVDPDVWESASSDVPIVVKRVVEETEVERSEIPFQRRTVRNRALPEGETRVIQPGQNGLEEVVYRVTLEDGEEVLRKEVQRRTTRPATDEIVMVGSGGQVSTVPISGTLAYVSSGNAWVMRDNSGSRRSLTSSGDLDQRVFALSPDGSQLIFTRGVAEGPPTPLNTLWVITTTVVGDVPQPLGVEGAVYVEWMQDNESFVYSTADRTSGSPGWKARNDLHIFSMSTMTDTRTLSGPPEDLYGWWGSRFALSPDDRQIAYATAEAIGLINLRTGRHRSLVRFPVYHTYSEWVWVPCLSWSPDGRYLAVTVHGEGHSPMPEDSPVFDVSVLSADGEIGVKLVPEAGMWAMPSWSPGSVDGTSQIAYGQAREPRSSQNSLYDLYVADSDGSNDLLVFPDRTYGLRLPQVTWSPEGDRLLFVRDDDIYLLDIASNRVHTLTDDGYSGLPRWTK